MALVLKTGKTYTDKHGYTGSDFYAVIDISNGDKKSLRQEYFLDIYANQTARDEDKEYIERHVFCVCFPEFNEKFKSEKLNPIDKNPYKNAYNDVMDQEINGVVFSVDWESD